MKRFLLGFLVVFALILSGCGGGPGGGGLDDTSKNINSKLPVSSDAETVSSTAVKKAEDKANPAVSHAPSLAFLPVVGLINKSGTGVDVRWSQHSDGWYYAENAPAGVVYKYRETETGFQFHGERNTTEAISPPATGETSPGQSGALYTEGTLQFKGNFDLTVTVNADNTWSGTQTTSYTDLSKGITYLDSTKTEVRGGWDDTFTGNATLTITNGNMNDGTGNFEYVGSMSYTDNIDETVEPGHIDLSIPTTEIRGTFTITRNGSVRTLSGTFTYDGNTIPVNKTLD
ncbi:MAG TPA: hypothetical protein VF531_00590 [Bacillota bacterium]